MAQESSDFRKALERVCSGSEADIWNFIEEYGPHIQRVVHYRLHQSMRSKFDSIDFVQMVWASLFANLKKIRNMRDPEELIMYLAGMARNKVIEETRRRLRFQRYNLSKECALPPDDCCQSKSVQQHDTPSAHVMAKEQMQRMLSSRRDRRIVEMRLKGARFADIAKAMGMHERTIRQIVGEIEAEAVSEIKVETASS